MKTAIWLLLMLTASCGGFSPFAAAFDLPARGEAFEIHLESITSGTVVFEGTASEPVHQRMEVWGRVVVRSSDARQGLDLRYSFDRLLLEVSSDRSGASRLEVMPGKVILDGTSVYDREKNPDLPIGLLDLVINEEFGVRLSPRFDVEEIREFRRNRGERSFFDLLSVVRETLAPLPPEGTPVGESWGAIRPMEALGGAFTVEATDTFRWNEAATAERPILTLQKTTQSRLRQPLPIPIRMGLLAKGNLAYDALGPNLIAPPPRVRVLDFTLESRGVIEFDTEWGFVRTAGSMADITLDCEIPPPDGVKMQRKTLLLNRQTLVQMKKLPDSNLSPELERLLLGDPAAKGGG